MIDSFLAAVLPGMLFTLVIYVMVKFVKLFIGRCRKPKPQIGPADYLEISEAPSRRKNVS